MKKLLLTLFILGILIAGAWAVKRFVLDAQNDVATIAPAAPTSTPPPTPSPTPVIAIKELPITLPMIDALFFIDLQFATELKSKLQLTDEQISELRKLAREETTRLQEDKADSEVATTTAAGEKAATKVSGVLGAEKAQQFADLALERWQKLSGNDSDTIALGEQPTLSGTPSPVDVPAVPGTSPSPSPSASPGVKAALTPSGPFSAPPDTRIIVNAPAHRMDIFQNGQLIKSYSIGIGYPEFPLPAGMRKATQIIFNPTWTPPDEPWVESSSKVKVGQKIAAGDKLNPLGVIKIPIGLPSLIHGGKQPAKIGTFASHGCVGMTDKQVQSFAKVLAQVGGVPLSDEEVTKQEQNRKETKVVKLKNVIPVELRYETLAVEDSKLHIYRDVYDRDTNVKENLEALLGTYGVTMADLTEAERTQTLASLAAMSRHPNDKSDSSTLTEAEKAEQRKINIARQQLTRQVKGRKEIVVEIAALAGKGYPAPVDLETGQPPKPAATPAKAKETRKKGK